MKPPLSGPGTRPGAIPALQEGALLYGGAAGAPGQASGGIALHIPMTRAGRAIGRQPYIHRLARGQAPRLTGSAGGLPHSFDYRTGAAARRAPTFKKSFIARLPPAAAG